MRSETIKQLARECGFELVGVTTADPPADFARYQDWVAGGMAGEMRYLTDRRGGVRQDVRNLLPSARSVICVGKLYNTSPETKDPAISRYAWGSVDYHDLLRSQLAELVQRLKQLEPFESKICVDTAPLLERSLARDAGLGWIGKNTCLINQPQGSWFFLGEVITSLELQPDSPPPDRCGTCTSCIDACPTQALVPDGEAWKLDARLCISYLTIELRGPIPEELRAGVGHHLFGCDICQDVCPWNRRAPVTDEPGFQMLPWPASPEIATMSEDEFNARFARTPVARAGLKGLLRMRR